MMSNPSVSFAAVSAPASPSSLNLDRVPIAELEASLNHRYGHIQENGDQPNVSFTTSPGLPPMYFNNLLPTSPLSGSSEFYNSHINSNNNRTSNNNYDNIGVHSSTLPLSPPHAQRGLTFLPSSPELNAQQPLLPYNNNNNRSSYYTLSVYDNNNNLNKAAVEQQQQENGKENGTSRLDNTSWFKKMQFEYQPQRTVKAVLMRQRPSNSTVSMSDLYGNDGLYGNDCFVQKTTHPAQDLCYLSSSFYPYPRALLTICHGMKVKTWTVDRQEFNMFLDNCLGRTVFSQPSMFDNGVNSGGGSGSDAMNWFNHTHSSSSSPAVAVLPAYIPTMVSEACTLYPVTDNYDSSNNNHNYDNSNHFQSLFVDVSSVGFTNPSQVSAKTEARHFDQNELPIATMLSDEAMNSSTPFSSFAQCWYSFHLLYEKVRLFYSYYGDKLGAAYTNYRQLHSNNSSSGIINNSIINKSNSNNTNDDADGVAGSNKEEVASFLWLCENYPNNNPSSHCYAAPRNLALNLLFHSTACNYSLYRALYLSTYAQVHHHWYETAMATKFGEKAFVQRPRNTTPYEDGQFFQCLFEPLHGDLPNFVTDIFNQHQNLVNSLFILYRFYCEKWFSWKVFAPSDNKFAPISVVIQQFMSSSPSSFSAANNNNTSNSNNDNSTALTVFNGNNNSHNLPLQNQVSSINKQSIHQMQLCNFAFASYDVFLQLPWDNWTPDRCSQIYRLEMAKDLPVVKNWIEQPYVLNTNNKQSFLKLQLNALSFFLRSLFNDLATVTLQNLSRFSNQHFPKEVLQEILNFDPCISFVLDAEDPIVPAIETRRLIQEQQQQQVKQAKQQPQGHREQPLLYATIEYDESCLEKKFQQIYPTKSARLSNETGKVRFSVRLYMNLRFISRDQIPKFIGQLLNYDLAHGATLMDHHDHNKGSQPIAESVPLVLANQVVRVFTHLIANAERYFAKLVPQPSITTTDITTTTTSDGKNDEGMFSAAAAASSSPSSLLHALDEPFGYLHKSLAPKIDNNASGQNPASSVATATKPGQFLFDDSYSPQQKAISVLKHVEEQEGATRTTTTNNNSNKDVLGDAIRDEEELYLIVQDLIATNGLRGRSLRQYCADLLILVKTKCSDLIPHYPGSSHNKSAYSNNTSFINNNDNPVLGAAASFDYGGGVHSQANALQAVQQNCFNMFSAPLSNNNINYRVQESLPYKLHAAVSCQQALRPIPNNHLGQAKGNGLLKQHQQQQQRLLASSYVNSSNNNNNNNMNIATRATTAVVPAKRTRQVQSREEQEEEGEQGYRTPPPRAKRAPVKRRQRAPTTAKRAKNDHSDDQSSSPPSTNKKPANTGTVRRGRSTTKLDENANTAINTATSSTMVAIHPEVYQPVPSTFHNSSVLFDTHPGMIISKKPPTSYLMTSASAGTVEPYPFNHNNSTNNNSQLLDTLNYHLNNNNITNSLSNSNQQLPNSSLPTIDDQEMAIPRKYKP
jgi:hypothetical protein